MKTTCSITVNFNAGNTIEDAFGDAVELATKLDCCIEFMFNNVICVAYPHDNPITGAKAYYQAVDKMVKFASTKKL